MPISTWTSPQRRSSLGGKMLLAATHNSASDNPCECRPAIQMTREFTLRIGTLWQNAGSLV